MGLGIADEGEGEAGLDPTCVLVHVYGTPAPSPEAVSILAVAIWLAE